jgi:rubrerythrin
MFARDAIKMALSMEARCLDFYHDAASRNQDPSGKGVFEHMVREEENHIAELNGKLEGIVKQEKDLEHAPVFLHFDPCELESVVPDLTAFERSGEFRLDAKASVELAISLIRDSAEFFKKYADRFEETQGKQILINFASQENAHGDLLRQRLEELVTASSTV